MTAQSKITIKGYFETGDRPTQAQFADFIDSYQDAATNLGTLTSASLTPRGLQLLASTSSQVTDRGLQLLSSTSAQVTDIGLAVLGAATSAGACNAIDAVKRSGDTMTGKLTTFATTSASVGLNIAPGVSPQTPNNGDIWVNASAAFIQVGATSYQIAPSNSSITEGTYTVSVTCGTSGTITLDGTNNKGSYERIGNLVTCRGKVTVASVSSPVGALQISLPFTVADLTGNAGSGSANVTLDLTAASNAGNAMAFFNETGTGISAVIATATTFSTALSQQVQANTVIYFSATYRAV
jgi:hypothetical protein